MLYILAFIISLVITMILIPLVMKWADRIGAIDLPDARKVHTQAIPRVGGIAMVAGSIFSILLLADLNQQIVAILTGFFIIWGFGLWDDKCNLNYKIKFFGQLLAVAVVVFFGDVVVYSFPFIEERLPYYLAVPLSVFALVGITNAINLSDGLDGLAGGTSLISISIIALLAFDTGGSAIVLISMSVAGSILGFLRHNTHPARLFMGDTGSQFLGFSLGVLVILLSQTVNLAMSPVIPLFILGLPIIDTMAVMGQRLYEHRSPFSPDKNHIHHRLLDLGLDHYEAVFIIYLIQSALISAAYFMLYESDALLLFIYIVVSICVFGAFILARVNQWSFHSTDEVKVSALHGIVRMLRSKGLLTIVPAKFMMLAVPLVYISSFILAEKIQIDMLILAVFLLVLLLLSSSLNNKTTEILEKIVVYVVSVTAVYIAPVSSLEYQYYNILNLLYLFLAIAFAVRVRFSHEKTFQATTLDYLVILIVIIVPNLPEVHLEDSAIGEMAIKLVILFYVSEAVMGLKERSWDIMRVGTLSALLILIFRGI